MTRHAKVAASECTDADYAIEHAEYLAKDAESYIEAVNHYLNTEDGEEEFSEDDVMSAAERMSEHARGLRNSVYEFRKRAKRAIDSAALARTRRAGKKR